MEKANSLSVRVSDELMKQLESAIETERRNDCSTAITQAEVIRRLIERGVSKNEPLVKTEAAAETPTRKKRHTWGRKQDEVQTNVMISKELMDCLNELSQRRNKSRSSVIREAITLYLSLADQIESGVK